MPTKIAAPGPVSNGGIARCFLLRARKPMMMQGTPNPPTRYGRLGEELITAYAYLHAPATIAHEIAWLQQARARGDLSESVSIQLADWRAIRDRQRELLQEVA